MFIFITSRISGHLDPAGHTLEKGQNRECFGYLPAIVGKTPWISSPYLDGNCMFSCPGNQASVQLAAMGGIGGGVDYCVFVH